MLKEWEKRNPRACLGGETTMLRVRLLKKAGNISHAIRYAKVLADNMEQNPYTPESYFVLITMLTQARRYEEAQRYYERLKDEYPESRFLKDIEAKENIIGLQSGKDK